MEFNALWTKRKALGWAGTAMIWTATTAQAQLYIHIYPSQDDPTKTLWIFSGDSTANRSSSIRSSQNYHARDSWKSGSPYPIYFANKPTNQVFNLSPLFSSTNNPIDIESVRRRIPGGDRTQDFAANVTNTPTITIGSTSRTIGSLFMNDTANSDEIGIRNTPPNLVFTNGQTSRWIGSGILNKPIGDFFNPAHPQVNGFSYYVVNTPEAPYFSTVGQDSIRMLFSNRAIPEPAEYALVFGLFALGFAFFRHFRKKPSTKFDL